MKAVKVDNPVLLINPKCADPPPIYYGPPYGLALIAACLEQGGKRVLCLDFESDDEALMLRKTEDALAGSKARVVGIPCSTGNRGYAFGLARAIKSARPGAAVIFGGPLASAHCELILDNFPVDFVVIGDGEVTLGELIDCLDSGGDLSGVDGIAFRNSETGGVVRTGERARIRDLDTLPYPAFHLFDVEEKIREHSDYLATLIGRKRVRSLRGKRCASIPNALMLLSSIGCSYGCSFCPMSTVGKDRYRKHSPKYFVDMVEHFRRKYGQKYFVFGDNLFTQSIERAKDICRKILERKLDIEWICMTRTDHLDQEVLTLMREAGCIEIAFGVESCSEKIQRKIGKRLRLDTVGQAFSMCGKAGLRSVLGLMVGNPGEDAGTILETLSRVRDLEPDDVQVKITKLYPGTKLHEAAVEKGAVSLDYYLTPDPKPPAYTLEHGPARLEELKAMIGPRDVRLVTQTACNNNCVHCSVRARGGGRTRTTAELEGDILKLARRCHTLTLAGEPAIRRDFFDLLRFAADAGVSRLRLETNARMFGYGKLMDRMAGQGIGEFIVHFPTSDEALHDRLTKVPGAFGQSAQGIENLCKAGRDAVSARIDITGENAGSLEDTVDFLCARGITRFHFACAPRGRRAVFTAAEAARALRPVLDGLKGSGKTFSVEGIAYCRLPGFESAISEIHRPFDEIYTTAGKLVNAGAERRKKKRKTAECEGCEHDGICEGFWKSEAGRPAKT